MRKLILLCIMLFVAGFAAETLHAGSLQSGYAMEDYASNNNDNNDQMDASDSLAGDKEMKRINAYISGQSLRIEGIEDGKTLDMFTITGAKIISEKIENGAISLSGVTKGIYIIRIDGYRATKITIK